MAPATHPLTGSPSAGGPSITPATGPEETLLPDLTTNGNARQCRYISQRPHNARCGAPTRLAALRAGYGEPLRVLLIDNLGADQ